jgi:hypothetical protein
MSLVGTIVGGIFAALGLGLSVYSWYAATAEGKIIDGLSYAGPFFLVVGLYRVFASASAVRLPAIFRIIAVLIGVGVGYGNTALQKAIYPSDRVITASRQS